MIKGLNAMKKHFAVLFILFHGAFYLNSMAQGPKMPPPPPDEKTRQKLEAARAAVITEQLDLTPEQAQKFWPIYNEYSEKREVLRREFFEERRKMDPKNPDPETEQKVFNLGLDIRQRELDLDKEYFFKMMSVLSGQQMMNLRSAERHFHQMVMNQLQQRRNMQHRKENFRDRNPKLKPQGN